MTTQLTKSEEALKNGWGGDLTHETVGQLMCLAAEISNVMYYRCLEFISKCPGQSEINAFKEELEKIVDNS